MCSSVASLWFLPAVRSPEGMIWAGLRGLKNSKGGKPVRPNNLTLLFLRPLVTDRKGGAWWPMWRVFFGWRWAWHFLEQRTRWILVKILKLFTLGESRATPSHEGEKERKNKCAGVPFRPACCGAWKGKAS